MSTAEIQTFECGRCHKQFITETARDGHRSMCPELSEEERSGLDKGEWPSPGHGRWSQSWEETDE